MKISNIILLVVLQVLCSTAEKEPLECTTQVARVQVLTLCQFMNQHTKERDVTKIKVTPSTFQGQVIDSPRVDAIQFAGSNLDNIPPVVFKNFGVIKNLMIYHSDVKNINHDDFSTAENLKKITIVGTKIGKIAPKAFESLKNLEELNIEKCEIGSFPEDAFDGLENLKTVNFIGNTYAQGTPKFTNTAIQVVFS